MALWIALPCLCSASILKEKTPHISRLLPFGPEPMDIIIYIWHIAFWVCKTHWTPLFQVKTYRIVICAQSTLHILLQPYDLLNDLKINNKLIYSALYATCLRFWDIARYKTLKSWPAPRLAQPQKCTKFLGPQVLKTILYKWQSAWKSLDNLFFHIVESTSIIWTWLCKWLQQPDFIPKWEPHSWY